MYKRKTRDIFDIYTNYGYGWEVELQEDSYKEAKEQVKCYRENCKELIGIKIVKRREKIEE